jgi:hypothetical protein
MLRKPANGLQGFAPLRSRIGRGWVAGIAYGVDDVTLGFDMEGSASIALLNDAPGFPGVVTPGKVSRKVRPSDLRGGERDDHGFFGIECRANTDRLKSPQAWDGASHLMADD